MAAAVPERGWTPLVYNAMDMCYNNAGVACASRTATRDREERIDTRDHQEEPHEDHYPQCRAR